MNCIGFTMTLLRKQAPQAGATGQRRAAIAPLIEARLPALAIDGVARNHLFARKYLTTIHLTDTIKTNLPKK